MKATEIIDFTEVWLKNVNSMKEKLEVLDPIKDIREINWIKFRLAKIKNAMSILTEENQRIICYRYFEKLSYSQIARRVKLSNNTIPKRIKKLLLEIGRIMFGYEDEFWNEFQKRSVETGIFILVGYDNLNMIVDKK